MFNNKKAALGIGVVALLLLILYTLLNSHPIFWDEEYYLFNIARFHELGLSYEFFSGFLGPAGPTHTLVHMTLSSIFNYEVPFIRLINVLFLIISILVLHQIISKVYGDKIDAVVPKILGLLSIPMVYVVSGLVLTEIPAIFFLLLSIYLIVSNFFSNHSAVRSNYAVIILSGLCFGLAILGRQPFLLLFFPFLFLFYLNNKFYFTEYVIFGITALILILPIFYIWGGVLPKAGGNDATRTLVEPTHLLLAGGYTFLTFLFLVPDWLNVLRNKKLLIFFSVSLLLVLTINLSLKLVAYAPMKTVASTNLPASVFYLYEHTLPAFLFVCGFLLLYMLLSRLWVNKADMFYIFSMLALIMIVSTSLFVSHQFSSRYVAQALPFFMIIAIFEMKLNKKELFMRVLGVIIGMISLNSFFN